MKPSSFLVILQIVIIFVYQGQTQDFRKGCGGEADLVFLIDSTPNVDNTEFTAVLNLLADKVIDDLEIGKNEQDALMTRVGIASLAGNGYQDIALDQYENKEDLKRAIREITNRRESANVPANFDFVKNVMFQDSRKDVPNVMVIISDSLTNFSNARDVSLEVRGAGIYIQAAAYGTGRSKELIFNEYRHMVSFKASNNTFVFENIQNTADIFDDFITRICQQIPECAGIADITFVLDSSGSVGWRDWDALKEFTMRVIQEMYVAPEGVHIAMITFSTTVHLHFSFQEYFNKAQMLDRVATLPFYEGSTNTAGALQKVLDVYSAEYGDRRNVRDIVLFVSDGASRINRELTSTMANYVHDADIRVFSIGIGKLPLEVPTMKAELIQIASSPKDEHYYHLDTFKELSTIEELLVSRTCREPPPECRSAIDLVIVLDESGSISEADFDRIVFFVRELATSFDIDAGIARVGVMTFSSSPKVIFHLDTYKTAAEVSKRIQQISYGHGSSDTAAAMRLLREEMFIEANGDRKDVNNVVLIITDGESNNKDLTIDEARLTRDAGVTILTLGIGNWVMQSELEGMASFPKTRNVFNVKNYTLLHGTVDYLKVVLCDARDECDSNPCLNGGKCVDGLNLYTCECSGGYAGKDCQDTCGNTADVIIALDSSGSIEKQNFYLMQDFVRDLIFGLNIEGGTRVGMLTFATSAREVFDLNAHNTTASTLNAMNLRFTGGTTNTADALDTMHSMYTPSRGDRADVQNIVVLLTDGKSDKRTETQLNSMKLKEKGVHVMCIGVGPSIHLQELLGIASEPNLDNVKVVPNFAGLPVILDEMLEAICNTKQECDSNPCQNGAICHDGIGTYECQCGAGFTGKDCTRSCTNEVDVAILVDSSGSIEKENFGHVQLFTKELVKDLTMGSDSTRISLSYFSDTSTTSFNLTGSDKLNEMMFKSSTMPFMGGKTNVADALKTMRQDIFDTNNGDRGDVPNFAVLIMDGTPNEKEEQTIPEAIEARISGVHVILVTVGEGMGKGTRNYLNLHSIASEPRDLNILNVLKFELLPSLVPQIGLAMCNAESECDSNPCQNGGTCLDGIGQYTCKCASRYTGPTCERQCSTSVDIAIAVDISGSLEDRYNIESTFMKEIITGLNFEFSRTRVSFITYAGEPSIKFPLNKYTTQRDILNAVSITHVGFQTDIYKVLKTVREDVFTANMGDRTGSENILLILSDGRSTINGEKVASEAVNVKNDEIKVYAIGFGDGAGHDTLTAMASSPTSSYLHFINTQEDVAEVADKVLDHICLYT